jgi:hypothetical protein
MKVYIVGFDPINDKAAVGAFDWHRRYKNAANSLLESIAEVGEQYVHWYRECVIGNEDLSDADITAHIQEQLNQYGKDGDW